MPKHNQKQPVVRKQRVKPWWKTDSTGQIVMSIKFGAKPIEFEKAKLASPSRPKTSCLESSTH
jgi:hypothetical protein